jgi:hypothetical protein
MIQTFNPERTSDNSASLQLPACLSIFIQPLIRDSSATGGFFSCSRDPAWDGLGSEQLKRRD